MFSPAIFLLQQTVIRNAQRRRDEERKKEEEIKKNESNDKSTYER